MKPKKSLCKDDQVIEDLIKMFLENVQLLLKPHMIIICYNIPTYQLSKKSRKISFFRYNAIMKKLWYQPFLAILASTFEMFGTLIFVFAEVFVGLRDLPKLVRIA